MAAAEPPPAQKSAAFAGRRALVIWHRRLGLFAVAFLVLLVVTGVLINHAPELGFDRMHVSGGWVSEHYGLDPKSPPVGYDLGGRWLVVAGEVGLLDGESVVDRVTAPRGAVWAGSLVVVADAHAVILLTGEGELIERLGTDALPGTVDAIGITPDDRVAIRSGDQVFLAGADFLGWSTTVVEDVEWSEPGAPPDTLVEQALARYRGPGIPLSRLLADIHSGHVLGSWGPWLVDGLAIVFLSLAATGFLNWFRSRR